MKTVALALAVCGLAQSEHPIVKVINMITELQETSKSDQESADIQYTKVSHTCDNDVKSTKKEIAKQTEEKEQQRALKEAKAEEVEALDAQLKELARRITVAGADLADAEKSRDADMEVYTEHITTLEDTVAAMKECIEELKKPSFLAKNSLQRLAAVSNFIQDPVESSRVEAFIALSKAPDAPKARVYDSKKGGVLDLFEKLLVDFTDKLNQKTKERDRSVASYKLATTNAEREISDFKADESAKDTQRGDAAGARATAESAETRSAELQAENEDLLRTTLTECAEEKRLYEKETSERSLELEAMKQVKQILAGVAGVRGKHEEVQKKEEGEAAAFLQLSRPAREAALTVLRAAVEKTSLKEDAMQLRRLISRIKRADSPFTQIINMVQKMIDELKAEQMREDDHKDWCDREVMTTEAAKEDTDALLDKLQRGITKAETDIMQSEKSTREARKGIEDSRKSIADKAAARQEQSRNNEVTVHDAEKAVFALNQALTVIDNWQKKRAASYGGTQQSSKVIDLLNGARDNYIELKATIEGQEGEQEVAFTQEKADLKQQIASYEGVVSANEEEERRLATHKQSLVQRHGRTDDKLHEVKQYLDDLQPACVDAADVYSSRKEARAKEVKALEDAKVIFGKAFDKPEEFVQTRHQLFLAPTA